VGTRESIKKLKADILSYSQSTHSDIKKGGVHPAV